MLLHYLDLVIFQGTSKLCEFFARIAGVRVLQLAPTEFQVETYENTFYNYKTYPRNIFVNRGSC